MIAAASIYVLDRTNGTIVSSGQKREYLLYLPKSYDPTKPTSLVISMHGAGGWPAQQMNLSHWNRLADENGFIVVYPSGTGVPKIWHVDRSAGLTRDVRFISELIDTVLQPSETDVSCRAGLGGELGSKKPVRSGPRRLRGRSGCRTHRIHALC